ncbi:uncharacterized protein LOC114259367 [Camellia sinensis]|uniref:uncharacterized protein LOC114259367 n=1 Tax=Camellia sinensis TaxID=4442 RepID=UPI0010357FC3|nr:uncharacterized protein LOC114259367 [Camellia sinensis]
MDTPIGASTSKQVKESVAEILDPEYIEIDNSTSENQPHFGVTDMLCVLDTNTRQENLTTPIDKDILIHFTNSISDITNSVISFTPVPIDPEDYEEWVLATVYASHNPNPNLREQLWQDLEDVVDTMQQPWLVAGDFNDYANQRERRSFSTNHNTSRTQKFLDQVNRCNLIDLGSSGPRMMWTNNRQGLANTMERLDRALCNAEWRTMFPDAIVRVLPRTYSDHSPLIVYTQVTKWNKEVFGNIFKCKRRLLARIEGRNALVPEI